MDFSIKADLEEEPGKYDVSLESCGEDSHRWCYLRDPIMENYHFTKQGIRLRGTHITLDHADSPTFLGIRQSEFNSELHVIVSGNASEAGITFYMDENHHYDLAVIQENSEKKVLLRLHVGDAISISGQCRISDDIQNIQLKVVSDAIYYSFFYVDAHDELMLGRAQTRYLSSEVAGGFTGTVMAMYAVEQNSLDFDEKWAEFAELTWKQR